VRTEGKNNAESYYRKYAYEDVFLFIYGLFMDAVSNSGNTIPNDGMINE
jgi:hypothetical protein